MKCSEYGDSESNRVEWKQAHSFFNMENKAWETWPSIMISHLDNYIASILREVGGGGSGLGTHIHLWRIHVDVWQNQYNIVK